MIEVLNLSFQWGKTPLLEKLSFSIEKGKIAAILGPSGSGKSTLFRILAGLIPDYLGVVLVNGNSSKNAHNQITMMCQEDLFLPWRSCLDNILLVSELEKKTPDVKRAETLLFEVGLGDCLKLYPYQLSGGMKKRLALARALFSRRPILLLDEPFVSVDVQIKKELYALIKKLSHRHDCTILFTTHDHNDVEALADTTYTISRADI